jgi:hypothetical protein
MDYRVTPDNDKNVMLFSPPIMPLTNGMSDCGKIKVCEQIGHGMPCLYKTIFVN